MCVCVFCDVLCFQRACFCLLCLCGLLVIDGVMLSVLVLCLLLFVCLRAVNMCLCALLRVMV